LGCLLAPCISVKPGCWHCSAAQLSKHCAVRRGCACSQPAAVVASACCVCCSHLLKRGCCAADIALVQLPAMATLYITSGLGYAASGRLLAAWLQNTAVVAAPGTLVGAASQLLKTSTDHGRVDIRSTYTSWIPGVRCCSGADTWGLLVSASHAETTFVTAGACLCGASDATIILTCSSQLLCHQHRGLGCPACCTGKHHVQTWLIAVPVGPGDSTAI
jgi:hypothetical protein